jgi:DNA repair exonuclease SbcCD ATPase subunit
MMKIKEFADPKMHPISNLESKMARAYRKTVEELESASKDLWKTMRADRSGGILLPYMLPEYETPALQIEDAQNRLAEIQSDIENFMNIVGSHSRHDVETKLHRCKLDIAKAKSQARKTLKRAIQENPGLSLDNVQKLDVVRTAFMERDRIVAEIKPLVTELEKKLNKANEILEKYR